MSRGEDQDLKLSDDVQCLEIIVMVVIVGSSLCNDGDKKKSRLGRRCWLAF